MQLKCIYSGVIVQGSWVNTYLLHTRLKYEAAEICDLLIIYIHQM